MRSASVWGFLTTLLLLLAPAGAWAVTTQVRITTPTGEPVASDYVVLDTAGNTVAEGSTDAEGEDEQELPPGVYVFRSGDRDRRVEIREGQDAASVSIVRSPVGLTGWGLDLGWRYGYLDQDGDLESDLGLVGADLESDALQLDGTGAGLYGRVRLPFRLLSGQPFVEVGGEVDLSDAEDDGGRSRQPGPFSETSFVRLDYQAGLSVVGGVEWETCPLYGDRGIRLRPYGGLAFGWWSGELVNDRTDFMMGIEREEEDFTTTSGRLGLELGVPLCACERLELDLVLGSHVDVPFGGEERTLELDGGLGQPIEGGIELEEAWGAHAGLELRWSPRLRY